MFIKLAILLQFFNYKFIFKLERLCDVQSSKLGKYDETQEFGFFFNNFLYLFKHQQNYTFNM